MVDSSIKVFDGDGHVFEDQVEIRKRLPAEWVKNTAAGRIDVTSIPGFNLFPALDHLRHGLASLPAGTFQNPGPEGWSRFLDESGIQETVLYPTFALGFGRIPDPDLAIGVAKAYNNWLSEIYTSTDARIQGIALLPMQEPHAAAEELRRVVTELGFPGGMLPTTGLSTELGSRQYWPVYEEANRLGCTLAAHGGSHIGFGFDQLGIPAGVHAMGHPFSITVAFVSMLLHGVFDHFPNVRFGFLEAGVGWFLMALERCTGSYDTLYPLNPRQDYLKLEGDESVADYVKRKIASGNLVVGVEGDEPTLGWAVNHLGNKGFVFSSDFPHEVTLDSINAEIDELLENDELTQEDKEAVLGGNGRRIYNRQSAIKVTA